jgi:HEPN domain-containing protein
MTRTKSVSREKYEVFWKRARQYQDSMEDSFSRGAYDACVSHAVHCAISSIDAITVLRIGKKSSAQNHNEIVMLLKDTRTHDESEKGKIIDSIFRLIEMKTLAEYEDKSMSKGDAEKAVDFCKKVFNFGKDEIES